MACVNEWSMFSFSLIIFHNRKREHNQYSFVLVENIIVEVLIKIPFEYFFNAEVSEVV